MDTTCITIILRFALLTAIFTSCTANICNDNKDGMCCFLGKPYRNRSPVLKVPIREATCIELICNDGQIIRQERFTCAKQITNGENKIHNALYRLLRRKIKETTTTTTTTPRPKTTTTPFYFTPLYCFYSDPNTHDKHVWRGGTNHSMTDGRMCRCEWWGRVNCHETTTMAISL